MTRCLTLPIFALALTLAPALEAQHAPPSGRMGYSWRDNDGWVQVTEVTAGLPAANAGLRAGDFILSCDGVEIPRHASSTLARKILDGPPGTTSTLIISRNQQQYRLDVTRLGVAPPAPAPAPAQRGLMGFNWQFRDGYVQITELSRGYPAERAGLQVGDFILEVDGIDIPKGTTMDNAQSIMSGAAGSIATLTIYRNNQRYAAKVSRVTAPSPSPAPAPAPPPPPQAPPGIMGFSWTRNDHGLGISSLTPGYPAHRAGMRLGDTITYVGQYQASRLTNDQARALLTGAANTSCVVRVLREGTTVDLTIVRRTAEVAYAESGVMGFSWVPRNGCVEISAVTPGTPAAQAGLRVGDIIVACDGIGLAPGTSATQARSIMAGAPNTVCWLKIRRSGQEMDAKLTRVAAR